MPHSEIEEITSPKLQSKPKLGFSIDELVGKRSRSPSPDTRSHAMPYLPPRTTPPTGRFVTMPMQQNRVDVAPVMVDAYSPAFYAGHPGLEHGFPYVGSPCLPPTHQMHPTFPVMLGAETHPVYPWLVSRHGRFFHSRMPGGDASGFLIHPFRKPKRIRTAFSPSQLLQLEHAFEKNHYVVGNERRQLAQNLNLTETQVKVWFQNRRTKHKRQKQEDENCCNPRDSDTSTPKDHSSSLSPSEEEEEEEVEEEEEETSSQDSFSDISAPSLTADKRGIWQPVNFQESSTCGRWNWSAVPFSGTVARRYIMTWPNGMWWGRR